MDAEAKALVRAEQEMERLYWEAKNLPEAPCGDTDEWDPTPVSRDPEAARKWQETLARLDMLTDRLAASTKDDR